MAGNSPLVTLCLVVGLPMMIRYGPLLRSVSRPYVSRSISQSPAEVFLLFIVAVASIYHLWTLSPTSTAHRRAIDIFRRTGLPIGAPSTALRAAASTMSAQDLGLHSLVMGGEGDADEGDVVERLLNRLTSMTGRQGYLLLGPSALLECHYCKQQRDFTLYALLKLFLIYATQLVVCGILTASPITLDAIERSLPLLRWSRSAQPAKPASPVQRIHSALWRGPAAAVLSSMAVLETVVIFGNLGWDDRPSSWRNHWHHNMFLLRHTLLLSLTVLIYLYPTRPASKPPSALQVATALAATRDVLARATSNVALVRAGRDAIWQDADLRQAVTDFHNTHAGVSVDDESLLGEAARLGMLKADARKQAESLVFNRMGQMNERKSQAETRGD